MAKKKLPAIGEKVIVEGTVVRVDDDETATYRIQVSFGDSNEWLTMNDKWKKVPPYTLNRDNIAMEVLKTYLVGRGALGEHEYFAKAAYAMADAMIAASKEK